MAEWSNAPVLKTGEGHTSGGSNPSFSAEKAHNLCYGLFVLSRLNISHEIKIVNLSYTYKISFAEKH